LSVTASDAAVAVTAPTGITATVNTGLAGTGGARIVTLNGDATYVVTGLGAVTNNAVTLTTEAAANTGTLTVTTTDAQASIIVQAGTAGSGAFTLNATGGAGGGLTTVTALTAYASQTINMTGSSAVTAAAGTTSPAITILATDANAHIYINLSTTANTVDTYTGGTAIDTVDLGLGADVFNGGGGADIYNIVVATDTAVAGGFAAAGAVPTTAIGTTGMDVITGLVATNVIDLTGLTTGANLIVRNGGTMGAATAGDIALLRGTYASSANTFTPSIAGADSILVADNNGTTAAGGYNGVVLVGYVDAMQNDTLGTGGQFTSVLG
jgi:hypothetical protein